MYIKIKTIKHFLLISACIFFAGFNYLTLVKAQNASSVAAIDTDKDGLTDTEEKLYKTDLNNSDTDNDGYSDGVEVKSGYDPTIKAPGDKIATLSGTSQEQKDSTTKTSSSMTDSFIEETRSYINTKKDQTITNEDLQSFVNESFAKKSSDRITWDTLPEANLQNLKIKTQTYPELTQDEREVQLQKDAIIYLTNVSYLLASNLPTVVSSEEDLQLFVTEFQEHLVSLSTLNPDVAYFSDLGNRLELFSNQINELEVPETMTEIHTKFLRLVAGFLTLREEASPVQDPISQVILIGKIQDLSGLLVDFLKNDFDGYLSQLKNTQN